MHGFISVNDLLLFFVLHTGAVPEYRDAYIVSRHYITIECSRIFKRFAINRCVVALSTTSKFYSILYCPRTVTAIDRTCYRTLCCIGYENVFVSLNRYTQIALHFLSVITIYLSIYLIRFERKKNLLLALKAFQKLLADVSKESANQRALSRTVLVVAGGYDERVEENVSYLQVEVEVVSQSVMHTSFIASPYVDVCELVRSLVVLVSPILVCYGTTGAEGVRECE